MEILRNLPKLALAVLSALLLQAPEPVFAGGGENPAHFQGYFDGLRVYATARCGEIMRLGEGDDTMVLKDPVSMTILGSELPDVPMVIGVGIFDPEGIEEGETLVLYARSKSEVFVAIDGIALGISRAIGLDGFEDVSVLQGSSQGIGPFFQASAYPATFLEIGQPVKIISKKPLARSTRFKLVCP